MKSDFQNNKRKKYINFWYIVLQACMFIREYVRIKINFNVQVFLSLFHYPNHCFKLYFVLRVINDCYFHRFMLKSGLEFFTRIQFLYKIIDVSYYKNQCYKNMGKKKLIRKHLCLKHSIFKTWMFVTSYKEEIQENK